jgi:hypothetical protein
MRVSIGCLLLVAAAAAAAQELPESFVREPGPEQQAAVRAELGPGFRVLETDHFRVLSDTSVRYHRVVTGVLEQFYQQVAPRFFEREMAPLPFYLIDGGDDFTRFVQARGLVGMETDFGRYDPRTRTLYARRYFSDGRESGLGSFFHQTVRAMIDAEFSPDVPPMWFRVGFASLFETGRVLRGSWVYGNPNPWLESLFRQAFEAGRTPSLPMLLRAPEGAFRGPSDPSKIHVNAARSLFLALLLDHGEPALRELVRAMRERVPASAALSRATGGLPLDQLQTAWHRSIRKVNFGGDYLNRGTSAGGGLDILATGARLHPGYGELRVELASAYLEKADNGAALEHARAALRDPRCTHPQRALGIVARAIVGSNPQEARRALDEALSYQPWTEYVMEGDFEMLAWIAERSGEPSRASALRSELARLQGQDRRN